MEFLLKLALICSVAGLVGLWWATTVFSETVAIGSLTPDQDGSTVNVCGEITYKFVSKAGHIFMKLSDSSGIIDLVIFNTSVDKFQIPGLNDSICTTGKIELYEGNLEILPVKIQTADHQA